MKLSRRWACLFAAAAVAGNVFLLRAEIALWMENAVAGSAIEGALFRLMDVPHGPVLARRAPDESRSELRKLILKSPQNGDLYTIRAEEDERQLDFSAAEADWKRATELAADKTAALTALADFYHSRINPQKEVDTLLEAGKLPATGPERFLPDSSQRVWQAFVRASQVASESLLSARKTGQ